MLTGGFCCSEWGCYHIVYSGEGGGLQALLLDSNSKTRPSTFCSLRIEILPLTKHLSSTRPGGARLMIHVSTLSLLNFLCRRVWSAIRNKIRDFQCMFETIKESRLLLFSKKCTNFG